MSIEIVRKALEDWFTRRGLRLESELSDRELVLVEGNNRVYVRIANEEFPTESYIIDELSNAMRNRLKYNKAYIAFPLSARGLINGKLFRSHWVGVYLYDLTSNDPDKTVEELIPSIPIQTQQNLSEDLKRRLDDLEREIHNLREDFMKNDAMTLMKEVDELKGRLSKVEHIISELLSRVDKLERAAASVSHAQEERRETAVAGELPDFLSNNPWIEVLRRRGGEGG
ncbi:MAG: hypothetical protein ACP5NQ_06990 [Vulcanisaeta sp.]